jgi:hypothetical protein
MEQALKYRSVLRGWLGVQRWIGGALAYGWHERTLHATPGRRLCDVAVGAQHSRFRAGEGRRPGTGLGPRRG